MSGTGTARPNDDQTIDTVLELSKLLGMQKRPLPRELRYGALPDPRFQMGWYAPANHLQFVLDKSAVERFIEKVSRDVIDGKMEPNCHSSLHQLEIAAQAVLEVTLCHFWIDVLGIRMDSQEYKSLLSRFHACYLKHVTSPQHVLQTADRDEGSLVDVLVLKPLDPAKDMAFSRSNTVGVIQLECRSKVKIAKVVY